MLKPPTVTILGPTKTYMRTSILNSIYYRILMVKCLSHIPSWLSLPSLFPCHLQDCHFQSCSSLFSAKLHTCKDNARVFKQWSTNYSNGSDCLETKSFHLLLAVMISPSKIVVWGHRNRTGSPSCVNACQCQSSSCPESLQWKLPLLEYTWYNLCLHNSTSDSIISIHISGVSIPFYPIFYGRYISIHVANPIS